jgi:xanthine/uracil permease
LGAYDEMIVKEVIELVAVGIMPFGLASIIYERIKHGKSIGVRVIQFLSVAFVVPTILILALEGILSTESVAALLGTIIGYILSGIEEKEDKK